MLGEELTPPVACFQNTARHLETGSRAWLYVEQAMLYWALVFLIIAIVAGVFGFGGVAATAAGIAQILFYVFLLVFVVALIAGLAGRRRPPV